jgi:hypothetical protein
MDTTAITITAARMIIPIAVATETGTATADLL